MSHRLLVLADGHSIHTQKWIEGLSLTGDWEIYLISMNPAPVRNIMQFPNVKGVYQIAPSKIAEHGNNVQYFCQLPALRRQIRKINPHAISTLYLSSYGLMGSLLKGKAKLVHFVVGNDVMVFPDQGWLHQAVSKYAVGKADFVVSASKTMTARLVEKLKYSEERILTQQYGVSQWVMDFPQNEKSYDFVSNRAWIANSNVEYFLQILKRLPQSKTAIIGRTVPGSESLGERVQNSAQALQCTVMPPLPYEENIGMVASGRFIVSLTKSDGASLSVMEAMAVGAIPILSDILPNREWVVNGENGFLIPLNDVEEAIRRFEAALRLTPAERAEIIAQNKKIISERGSLSRNMHRVSQHLKSLVEGSDFLHQNAMNQAETNQIN